MPSGRRTDEARRAGLTQHPIELSEVDVPESGLEACAQLAVEDLGTMTNPGPVYIPAEVVEVYLQAM